MHRVLYTIEKSECSEMWSEYHTYKGCEDEVNCKGHLMKY